jgi:bacterioferritin-associated ferredoxin
MVIGVQTRCRVCHTPVRSCVLPAYCGRCNPAYRDIIERIREHAESARLNAKPDAAEESPGEESRDG